MKHHCTLKHDIIKEFLAEFLGTFVLVVSTCKFLLVIFNRIELNIIEYMTIE